MTTTDKAEALPAFPVRDPIHHEPGEVEVGDYEYATCPTCHAYERAMKEAYAARLRYAAKLLDELAEGDDWINAAVARFHEAIGPLPPSTPPTSTEEPNNG